MVWIWIAAVGSVLLVFGLAQFFGASRSGPDMRDLPPTPLERLGRVGLAVTATLGLGLAALVGASGVADFVEDGATRAAFYLMLLGGAAVWLMAWRRLRGPAGTTVIDERDRAIQARSFTVESVLVILSLVAWTVTLTEVFWQQGAVPLGYLQLIFWSTFIAGAFGRALGIVLGYRREPSADA